MTHGNIGNDNTILSSTISNNPYQKMLLPNSTRTRFDRSFQNTTDFVSTTISTWNVFISNMINTALNMTIYIKVFSDSCEKQIVVLGINCCNNLFGSDIITTEIENKRINKKFVRASKHDIYCIDN